MVKFLSGPKGSGKTKKLIDMANESVQTNKGVEVFLDIGSKHSLEVDKRIKFINIKDFNLMGAEKFYGFLCGLLCGNYDINKIYVDNSDDILEGSSDQMLREFLDGIETMCDLCFVDIIFVTNLDAIV